MSLAITVAIAAPVSPKAGAPKRPKISIALPTILVAIEINPATVGSPTFPVHLQTVAREVLIAVII